MFNPYLAIAQINFLRISRLELTKLIRAEVGIGLRESLRVADMMIEAHRQGVIRGETLRR